MLNYDPELFEYGIQVAAYEAALGAESPRPEVALVASLLLMPEQMTRAGLPPAACFQDADARALYAAILTAARTPGATDGLSAWLPAVASALGGRDGMARIAGALAYELYHAPNAAIYAARVLSDYAARACQALAAQLAAANGDAVAVRAVADQLARVQDVIERAPKPITPPAQQARRWATSFRKTGG